MSGPYLQMAVLCEKVLQEADGVTSIIRIVDRITLSAKDKTAPADMPAVPINLKAIIGFKSGMARGPYTVKVKPVSPSGVASSTIESPLLLEGEDRGAAMVLDLAFQAKEEGIYWFEVYLLDVLITRMPLRVVYQRLVIG